jgi:hypothetical protein
MHAGKPQKQAIAIAMSKAGKSRGAKDGLFAPEAYETGIKAGVRSSASTANPHMKGSREHSDWEKGRAVGHRPAPKPLVKAKDDVSGMVTQPSAASPPPAMSGSTNDRKKRDAFDGLRGMYAKAEAQAHLQRRQQDISSKPKTAQDFVMGALRPAKTSATDGAKALDCWGHMKGLLGQGQDAVIGRGQKIYRRPNEGPAEDADSGNALQAYLEAKTGRPVQVQRAVRRLPPPKKTPAKDAAIGPVKSIKRGNTTVSYHAPVGHQLRLESGKRPMSPVRPMVKPRA